jgi:hypothetical protein
LTSKLSKPSLAFQTSDRGFQNFNSLFEALNPKIIGIRNTGTNWRLNTSAFLVFFTTGVIVYKGLLDSAQKNIGAR